MAKAEPTPTGELRKGNCYQKVLEVLLKLDNSWVLVHGRPLLRRPPFCQYGHAWLECRGVVLDPECGIGMDKEAYYALGNIDPMLCVVYGRTAALLTVLEFGHYGPWQGPDAEPSNQTRRRQHG